MMNRDMVRDDAPAKDALLKKPMKIRYIGLFLVLKPRDQEVKFFDHSREEYALVDVEASTTFETFVSVLLKKNYMPLVVPELLMVVINSTWRMTLRRFSLRKWPWFISRLCFHQL